MSRWYEDGLRFRCTRCAHCCTGPQGYVWLSPQDRGRIGGYLGLSEERFLKRYARLVGHLLALVDGPGGDCIFLTHDKRCAIHAVKPRQCLTHSERSEVVAIIIGWRDRG